MKKIILLALLVVTSIMLFAQQTRAQEVLTGTWKTIADDGRDKGKASSYLQIYEKGGMYHAKVLKLLNHPQDALCKDCKGDLRDKPIVGMHIFSNMKKTGNVDKDFGEEYAGGQIMDPENGNFYRCKIWIKGDTIVVRGYLGFFYRTQRWYRLIK